MSAMRVILLTALAISLLPLPTAQANSCTSDTQSHTVGGNTATVLLEKCSGGYSYGTYSAQFLLNRTTVTVDTSQNYRVTVIAANYWQHASDPATSFESTQRVHSYQVQVSDTAGGQPFQGAGTNLGDNQYAASNYGCSEGTGASSNVGTTQGYISEGQAIYSGNNRVIPCTSSDIQNALP